jgi:hypothetical protein
VDRCIPREEERGNNLEQTETAMGKTQLRVDPADGNAYPLASFLECYGDDEGHRRWAAAGQQPAYTGISLCMCILAALLRVERYMQHSLSDGR